MDAAVWCSVRVADKARHAYRAIQRDKWRHSVLRAIQSCHCDLGVYRRAGPADHGKGMAAGATVEIEARAEADPRFARDRSGHRVDFLESASRSRKEFLLAGADTSQRAASARRAAAWAGVHRFRPGGDL